MDADTKYAPTESAFWYAQGEKAALAPHRFDDLCDVVFVPDGNTFKPVDIRQYADSPRRWDENRVLAHPNDLGRYIKDHLHKHPGTRIFASASGRTFHAILDYETAEGDPLWGTHRAAMTCQPSPEWQAWSSANGTMLSQIQMAELIDSQMDVIVEPEAASLKEMVLRLEQTTTVSFKQAVNMTSGLVDLQYTETEDSAASKSLKLPGEIKLALRPFTFSSQYAVRAKLRYRIKERALTFAVHLHRPDLVIDAAWRDVVQAVENASGIAPYLCP